MPRCCLSKRRLLRSIAVRVPRPSVSFLDEFLRDSQVIQFEWRVDCPLFRQHGDFERPMQRVAPP